MWRNLPTEASQITEHHVDDMYKCRTLAQETPGVFSDRTKRKDSFIHSAVTIVEMRKHVELKDARKVSYIPCDLLALAVHFRPHGRLGRLPENLLKL
jgi:hypothetical protein